MNRPAPQEIFLINALEVLLSREQHRLREVNSRFRAQERRKREFLHEYNWDEADGPSTIETEEAADLKHWCCHQSWSHCPNCLKLSMKKLLPSFRRKSSPKPRHKLQMWRWEIHCSYCGRCTFSTSQPHEGRNSNIATFRHPLWRLPSYGAWVSAKNCRVSGNLVFFTSRRKD